jgi:hypothetical protein
MRAGNAVLRDPGTGHTVEVWPSSYDVVGGTVTRAYRFDDGVIELEPYTSGGTLQEQAIRLLIEYPIRQPYQHSKSILI